MDYGYPQNLSPEILKLYITQEGFRSPFSKVNFVLFLFSLGTIMSFLGFFFCFFGILRKPQFLISISPFSPLSQKQEIAPPPNATLQVTGAVGWRREGLFYKKNEVNLAYFCVKSKRFLLRFSENYNYTPPGFPGHH